MIWLAGFKSLLLAFVSRNGIMLALIAGGLAAFWTYDSSRVERGKQIAVEAAKEQGRIANAKNEKVRARARVPGAAERLLEQSCRDCNQ